MNIYLTTIFLNDQEKSNRRLILDSCIESLIENKNKNRLKLKGIIVPDYRNPQKLKEYMGIEVQSVRTREGNPDPRLQPQNPELLKHRCTNKHERKIINRKRHWTRTPEEARNEADNEHQAMFEAMQVESPCLISDGDILFSGNDFSPFIHYLKNLKESKVIFPRSHLIFLKNENDKNRILIDAREVMGGIYYNTIHCRRNLIDKILNKK